jgi:hypothetical protein
MAQWLNQMLGILTATLQDAIQLSLVEQLGMLGSYWFLK